MMNISQNGIDLIKKFEGCELKAYKCPSGIWTIGYGHTEGVTEGQTITPIQAEEYLKADIVKYENAINVLVKVPINQNQFSALVSFVYNIGVSAFENSTLLRLLNDRNYNEASNQFDRWVYGGTNKLQGLVNRRKAERELFLNNDISNTTTNYTIRDFQQAYNNQYNNAILVDNIWGSETNKSISDVLVKEGYKGDLVGFIQIRVGATVDGVFGNETKQKVMEYQKLNGLCADGIVGANTMRCILNQYK